MYYVYWADDGDFDIYGPFKTREEAWEWATDTLVDHFSIEYRE